ncbi:MAG TPA: site-specific integrase [Candidatus Acidoferrales bacterium]|nr:site-specific integrase [Candidatus Acidoferrales bacterium]
MARRAKGEGSLIQRKGCKFWYASFYDESGKQQRVSTKEESKQSALAVLRKLMGKSERGEAVKETKLAYGDIRGGLIANYVERGNKTLEVGIDGTEIVNGLRALDSYCGYVPAKDDKPGNPGVRVAKITTDFAREFAKQRAAEGLSNATINRSLQCLRRMLNIAKEDGKIIAVPKIRLLKEPAARKGFLPLEKFEELLAALPVHLRPLITFLYYCGVRLGEALQVEWSQVDLKAALIRLEEEQTKSGEARVIPLPDVLVSTLSRVEPKRGRVFDSKNLRSEWVKACVAVGLGTSEEMTSANGWKWDRYSGLIVHDLRRSAVRNLRLAGVSETVAMKISGHKTPEVFRRYNIVSTDDVTAAMRAVESAAPISARSVQSGPSRKVKLLKK